jgi:uncharacterized damage-inducible protein DinB
MQQTLDNLRAFEARLTAAIDGLSERELTQLEGEGKWSITDVVAHLADLEMIYAVRIRTILAGAGGDTPLPSLAQNQWVERVHRREPISELLEQFRFHRRMNLTLLERLSEEELSRSGRHPEYGALTVRDAYGRIERHDAKHLAQIERVRARVTGQS